MKLTELLPALKKRLEGGDLPGQKAHMKMLPLHRKINPDYQSPMNNPMASSVLILLYPIGLDAAPGTILIKRGHDNSVHSGQISFPGGKRDDTDLSLTHTALREAKEEIGIEPGKVEVIGFLSQLYVSPSNFMINPVVGYVQETGKLKANPDEVDQIIELPLMGLASFKKIVDLEVRGYKISEVPCFSVNGHIVWGATAMILQELLDVILCLNPDSVNR